MADRLIQTYLVEHYRPGVEVEDLKHSAGRVRAAIAAVQHEGSHVAFVSSTIVPDDDYLHCVVQAPSEDFLQALLAHAGITYERISTAITVEG